MKNLILQYYIPYESFDADMGGVEMPDWAKAGSENIKKYAEYCGAEYMLCHDRYFERLDPRLDSLRMHYDEQFDKYDNVLKLDLANQKKFGEGLKDGVDSIKIELENHME